MKADGGHAQRREDGYRGAADMHRRAERLEADAASFFTARGDADAASRHARKGRASGRARRRRRRSGSRIRVGRDMTPSTRPDCVALAYAGWRSGGLFS
jgi:hypothetical protein